MSSFARRLRRFQKSAPQSALGREAQGALGVEAQDAVAQHMLGREAQSALGVEAQDAVGQGALGCEAQAAAASPASGGSARVLQELREKMASILQRPLPEQPRSEVMGLSALEAFERVDAGSPYWRRRHPVRRSQRVGRRDCALAAEADPALLALLAFDADLAEVDFRRALYLDTETTGLGAGAGTYAFLVGVCYFEREQLWLEQLLLEGPEQETALLQRLTELIERSEVLVTFNGKSFDWPLLEARFVMNRLRPPRRLPHLDLLHLCRRVHRYRLAQCRLTQLEAAVLGFERSGDIEGQEVALRYSHYLRSGDASGLVAVVEHNYWDVLSMAALVAVYGQPEPELCASDWLGLAQTYRRAKAFERAASAAQRAAQLGEREQAAYIRALVHKALGERMQALAALEQAPDNAPVRLELAKLYEHFLKQPERALAIAARGTGEPEPASARRLERLQAKLLDRRRR